MSAGAHSFTKFNLSALEKLVNLSSDTLKVLLMVSYTAAQDTHQYVSDVTGAGTEVSGGGYSRQSLTSVTLTDSGHVTTLTAANPSWSSATFSAAYAVFYDSAPGTDATDPVICWWDFGGTQTVTAQTFTLTVNASGILTVTGS